MNPDGLVAERGERAGGSGWREEGVRVGRQRGELSGSTRLRARQGRFCHRGSLASRRLAPATDAVLNGGDRLTGQVDQEEGIAHIREQHPAQGWTQGRPISSKPQAVSLLPRAHAQHAPPPARGSRRVGGTRAVRPSDPGASPCSVITTRHPQYGFLILCASESTGPVCCA